MLEGGNWLDGKTRLYTYKPNTIGATHGHPFLVNRLGFRGPEFLERSHSEVPDAFRIMVLGDSVTSGIGIAEEDRYTNILERKLRARDLFARLRSLMLVSKDSKRSRKPKSCASCVMLFSLIS